MREEIIILDFGSQYTQLIARRIRELNVFCEIYPYNKAPEISDSIKGLILSGSPCSVHDDENPDIDFIFSCVTDPVGLGLIDSFETYPTANFTGVCYPVHVSDRLRFIKKTMPKAKKIGLVKVNL